jgi:hypothetical protein
MSQMGQERRIGTVRNISALPLRADVGADIVEPPVSAITGSGSTMRSTGNPMRVAKQRRADFRLSLRRRVVIVAAALGKR